MNFTNNLCVWIEKMQYNICMSPILQIYVSISKTGAGSKQRQLLNTTQSADLQMWITDTAMHGTCPVCLISVVNHTDTAMHGTCWASPVSVVNHRDTVMHCTCPVCPISVANHRHCHALYLSSLSNQCCESQRHCHALYLLSQSSQCCESQTLPCIVQC